MKDMIMINIIKEEVTITMKEKDMTDNMKDMKGDDYFLKNYY